MEALLADDPSAFFTIPPRGRRHAAALGGRSFTEQACYERLLQLWITALGWRASAFGVTDRGATCRRKAVEHGMVPAPRDAFARLPRDFVTTLGRQPRTQDRLN